MAENNSKSVDNECMEDSEEYYDRIERLLIDSQNIRNESQRSTDQTEDPGANPDAKANGALTVFQVWMLEETELSVQMLDMDYKQMSKNVAFLQSENNKIEAKVNETIDCLKLINGFKANQRSDDLIEKMAQNLGQIEESFDQKLINGLVEEIQKKEELVALMEVWLLENQTVEELVCFERQLRTEIKSVDNDLKNLTQERNNQELIQMVIKSEIKALEQKFRHFLN